jgi:hypothetical protein
MFDIGGGTDRAGRHAPRRMFSRLASPNTIGAPICLASGTPRACSPLSPHTTGTPRSRDCNAGADVARAAGHACTRAKAYNQPVHSSTLLGHRSCIPGMTSRCPPMVDCHHCIGRHRTRT